MLSENFVYLAAIITVVGNLAYISDTLKGDTKPNRVTFFLWGLLGFIAFFAQRSAHGGLETLFTLAIASIPFIVFACSFVNKKAYWAVTRFDVICGLLSVVAILLWLLTGDPLLALLFSLLADLFAGIPTIVKSYKYPETETRLAYIFEIISAAIVVLTVHDWTFAHYGFAVYILCMNVLFTILLSLPKNWRILNTD